jgi:hypothetical protein
MFYENVESTFIRWHHRINKAMSGKYKKNPMRINKTSTSET